MYATVAYGKRYLAGKLSPQVTDEDKPSAITIYRATTHFRFNALLLRKQLGRGLEQQHSGYRGQDGLGQHIAAVVGQAVDPCGQAVTQVAPDQHAGQKAAQKADATHRRRADSHTDRAVLEQSRNSASQSQQGKGQHIVQQNHPHQRQQAGGRGCVEAQQHLQQAVDEAGEQTPLHTVAEGDHDERQHAEQRDGAAVGQLIDLDVGQHRAEGDHQGALDEGTGLGIGFGHGIHSSKNL